MWAWRYGVHGSGVLALKRAVTIGTTLIVASMP
jgi:hypothetical protein